MMRSRRLNGDDDESKEPALGIRHLQCFLMFCGLGIAYALRVNLSVAIVAMTNPNSTTTDMIEYEWSLKTKSVVLSSFFWGYVITQVPGGALAQRFGGKVMLLYTVLISGLLAILTPLSVELGNWQLLCALRFIQGLSQGPLFSVVHTILSKWAPVNERGILTTFAYSGTQMGTILMLAFSGILASSSLGWPGIFYVSGGVSLIWVAAWIIWGASSPDDFKSIPVAEKQLIAKSLTDNSNSKNNTKSLKTPWKDIFTSVPFLVLICLHCAHNWGFWTLLTQIPTYMYNVLGMDIKSNALLSSLPYCAMLVFCLVFCGISNFLEKYRMINLNVSRKLFNTIGQWIPMMTIVALGYVDREHSILAVILLTLTVGLNAAIYLGFHVNHMDLSPNFAGIMMGITNCAANIMSILAPLLVGIVVTEEDNPEQWRSIFFIAGGFYFLGNLLFILLGKTNVQQWNEPSNSIPQELELIKVNEIKE